MRPALSLKAFALAFALVIAACGGTTTEQAAGPNMADLSGAFETMDGGQLEFGSLEGQDVVLWFWAPW